MNSEYRTQVFRLGSKRLILPNHLTSTNYDNLTLVPLRAQIHKETKVGEVRMSNPGNTSTNGAYLLIEEQKLKKQKNRTMKSTHKKTQLSYEWLIPRNTSGILHAMPLVNTRTGGGDGN